MESLNSDSATEEIVGTAVERRFVLQVERYATEVKEVAKPKRCLVVMTEPVRKRSVRKLQPFGVPLCLLVSQMEAQGSSAASGIRARSEAGMDFEKRRG